MDEREELEALQREVARMRPLVAKMAELAGLAGQVLIPPDDLAKLIGWEVPEAPDWMRDPIGAHEWIAKLGHGILAGVTRYGEPGHTAYYYHWAVMVHVDEGRAQFLAATGQASSLDGAKRAALKAAEGVGVAVVARTRVGLKALEGVADAER